MAKHILIIAHGLDNVGESARLAGVLDVLRRGSTQTKFTIVYRFKDDIKQIEQYISDLNLNNVEFRKHPWLIETRWMIATAILSLFLLAFNFAIALSCYLLSRLTADKVKKINNNYDEIADLSLADMSDSNIACILGGILILSNFSYDLLSGKPVSTYSASVRGFTNPFWGNAFRFGCKIILSRLQIIVVRDEISSETLRKLGIKTKINICPDFAYLGFSVLSEINASAKHSRDQDQPNKPYIVIIPRQREGLSIKSRSNSQDAYVMAKLGDFCIEYFEVKVVFVPFSLGGFYDDFGFCQTILENMQYKQEADILKSNTLREITEVVSHCEVCVTYRIHGSVAASSCGVPSVIITTIHSPKYQGVTRCAIGEGIIPIIDAANISDEDRFLETSQRALKEVWEDRTSLRKILQQKMEEVRSRICCMGND